MAINSLTDTSMAEVGYRLHSTIYYTSSDSFVKAGYPWLRAIRVKVQGAGGGGASATRTTGTQGINVRGGGGGGAYMEKFITDIDSLAASETITVGAGGAGGADPVSSDTPAVGSAGGDSTAFGMTAGGGGGGVITAGTTCAAGGTVTGTGDFTMRGGRGGPSGANLAQAVQPLYGHGGLSFLGRSNPTFSNNTGGSGPSGYGAGREGSNRNNSSGGASGYTGGAGVVIVELYA